MVELIVSNKNQKINSKMNYYSHRVLHGMLVSFFVFGFFFPHFVQAATETEYVDNELVIRFAENENFSTYRVTSEGDIENILSDLQENPRVDVVERNVVRRVTALPDDPRYTLQLHHNNDDGVDISSQDAWDIQTGSSDVVVAVIDTGVDIDHADLADNIWINTGEIAGNSIDDDGNGYVDDVNGYDFVNSDGDPTPTPNGIDEDGVSGADSGVTHGTHVAGILGAVGNNAKGVTGVAWDVSIMAIQVLDDEGSGSDADIAEGIIYAVDNGADIINMSLGGFGSTTILEEAVAYAIANEVLVVTAVGNNGVSVNTNPFYPACYNEVVGVASIDDEGVESSFSNYGDTCTDIAAPGESIYSTLYTDDSANGFTVDYGYLSGTSMATPVVAGVLVLLKSERSDITMSQMIDVLSTTKINTSLEDAYGGGSVDAALALAGLDVLDAPPAPTLKAYSSSKKSRSYKNGARKADEKIYFTWNEPSDEDGIEGYYVYFGKDKNANPETSGTFQTARYYTSKKMSGNSVSYYLRVKAKDTVGDVTITAANYEYIIDTVVTKPKKVKLSLTSDGIRVEWNKVKGESVTKYAIRRKNITANGDYKTIKKVTHPTEEYIDKSVQRDKQYEYRVRAIDDLNNKKASDKKKKKFHPRERLVIGAGPGGSPQVRVYNMKKKVYEETWYAYDTSFRNGIELAVGELDGDKKDEIVTGLGEGGEPRVRVFEGKGTLKSDFNAYDFEFRGGVRVTTGDFDNDGRDEIATVPGPGGTPHVRVFEMNGTEIFSFMALDGTFTGGAFITGIDWNNDGRDEIAVSADSGGGSQVLLYDSTTGGVLTSFDAYDSAFMGGVRIGRATFDGKDALVTSPVTGSSHVQVFQKKGSIFSPIHGGFSAFTSAYTVGTTIGAGDINQKKTDKIIVGSNGDTQATVVTYTKDGVLKKTFAPFGSFTGAVRIASGWLK